MMEAKTRLVQGLVASCEGLTSRDVASGRLVAILVVCTFFCCMRRWPLLVASDLVGCLETTLVVRPGHDWKWPLPMAQRNVKGTGLKALPWWKAARSCFVCMSWMAPFAKCRRVFGTVEGVGG